MLCLAESHCNFSVALVSHGGDDVVPFRIVLWSLSLPDVLCGLEFCTRNPCINIHRIMVFSKNVYVVAVLDSYAD